MCLRPCQQVVGPAEYADEVARVADFLRTDGRSLLESIGHSRDRLSQEMIFEEAARQHKRFEKVQEVLSLRDELVRDIDRLNGVAITRFAGAGRRGDVVPARRHVVRRRSASDSKCTEGKPVSLDRQLRERSPRVAPAQADRARASGVSGAAGALVLLYLARRRMAGLRELRRHSLPQAGQRRFPRSPARKRYIGFAYRKLARAALSSANETKSVYIRVT